jgi:hypothetical protein
LDPETIARERAEDAARQPSAPDEPKADIETKKGKSA